MIKTRRKKEPRRKRMKAYVVRFNNLEAFKVEQVAQAHLMTIPRLLKIVALEAHEDMMSW